MAYKLTKYKGKHKLKNTKTGKSVDIDIEEYMNKPKEDVKKYNFGGDCPPGDFDCMKQKGIIPPPVTSDLQGFGPQLPKSQFKIDYNSLLNPSGGLDKNGNVIDYGEKLPSLNIEGFNNDNSVIMTEDELNKNKFNINNVQEIEEPEEIVEDVPGLRKEKSNYNIPNPYAGVDIPTAAFTLGQSIENGSGLGIAGSGLKLLSGLGRNVVSGLGYQNRYNDVMKQYMEDQKEGRNPTQYLAYGGKKDEELATGEYMHGVMNEATENYNAEIEQGEYFQTNQGDIAEVVGNKHTQGGEKIQMQAEDRVLSDQLKLGGKMAKELSKKYDLDLKAKHTYSDVLDKYKKKSKLGKLIEEEAEILKMIGKQADVQDPMTKQLNLKVLKQKKEDIEKQKDPIEERRKEMFDELFNIQEDSKPKKKEDNNFAHGGKLEALAQEYGIDINRAKEIIKEFSLGGELDELEIGDTDPVTGKKVTKAEAKKKVASGEWEDLGNGKYMKRGTKGSENVSSQALKSYRETWDKDKFPNFEDYVQAAEQWKKDNPNWRQGVVNTTPGTPDEYFYTPRPLASPLNLESRGLAPLPVKGPSGELDLTGQFNPTNQPPVAPEVVAEENDPNNPGLAGMYLFPTESPLPPTALQGTIKPNRRFDRVRPSEIDVEPYLRDIRDREGAQVQSLEGLSPNVRAAVLANMRANSQKQESQIRNQIDTQNLQSQERATYTNAQIQAREENASELDNLRYEQRQYRAQANTDNDLNNYYNQLQSINKQRFMDIHNLNLVNATNEDVYFDGQSFQRKNSDRDILRQVKV